MNTNSSCLGKTNRLHSLPSDPRTVSSANMQTISIAIHLTHWTISTAIYLTQKLSPQESIWHIKLSPQPSIRHIDLSPQPSIRHIDISPQPSTWYYLSHTSFNTYYTTHSDLNRVSLFKESWVIDDKLLSARFLQRNITSYSCSEFSDQHWNLFCKQL